MSDELDQILDEIDLKEWFDDQGIRWKTVAGGTNIQVQECPWCSDTRWKVYVSIKSKKGLCYHGECQQRFNLFSFARQSLSLDTRATIEHFKSYARTAGLSVRPISTLAPSVITTGWQLPASVPLPGEDDATHPFLTERHITLETQRRFGLRWCEEGVYTYQDAEGNARRQDFSQRVIIPVTDLDGTVQSFQGRATWQIDEEAGERRYLFPIGLPGTGRFLYGGNLVKGVPNLIINEGPFDVWSTHQAIAGHPDFKDWGVIGSFGLSIGQGDENADDQIARLRQLKREGLKRLVMMWDGERGATLAALEAAKMLSDDGFQVSIALLPFTKDPNDLSTREIRDAIAGARRFDLMTYIEWKMLPPYPDK